MSRKNEHKLNILQAEYATVLVAALKKCANGQWGLFGQNDASLDRLGKHARVRWTPPEIQELLDLGADIARLRKELGYTDPFPLHERLLKLRSTNHANTPGEPTLAQKWLNEMSA